MKWVLILALWNTNPPQDSFKFVTDVYDSQEECLEAVQASYSLAFDRGVQAQGVCVSEEGLGLVRSYS